MPIPVILPGRRSSRRRDGCEEHPPSPVFRKEVNHGKAGDVCLWPPVSYRAQPSQRAVPETWPMVVGARVVGTGGSPHGSGWRRNRGDAVQTRKPPTFKEALSPRMSNEAQKASEQPSWIGFSLVLQLKDQEVDVVSNTFGFCTFGFQGEKK